MSFPVCQTQGALVWSHPSNWKIYPSDSEHHDDLLSSIGPKPEINISRHVVWMMISSLNLQALLPNFHTNCPHGSHFAQNTTPNPCSTTPNPWEFRTKLMLINSPNCITDQPWSLLTIPYARPSHMDSDTGTKADAVGRPVTSAAAQSPKIENFLNAVWKFCLIKECQLIHGQLCFVNPFPKKQLQVEKVPTLSWWSVGRFI